MCVHECDNQDPRMERPRALPLRFGPGLLPKVLVDQCCDLHTLGLHTQLGLQKLASCAEAIETAPGHEGPASSARRLVRVPGERAAAGGPD